MLNCKHLAGGFLLLAAALYQLAYGKCLYSIGDYRNCTCGVHYRTVEQRCCSSESCLQPVLTTENRTCPFQCLNGGTFDEENNLCRCGDGYFGLCCQKETPLCGDVLLQSSGEFTSLNYPNRYPNGAKCVWRISTDPNRRIALGVKNKEFDLEPGSNIYSCDYDSVSVFDGVGKKAKSLGSFCGNIDFLKTFKTVYSSGSNLYVKFSSDHIIQRKGFRLQYSVFFKGQECGPLSKYTRPKGIITSPQYPIPYRPKEDCKWVIQVIPGKEVTINMHDIDIPAQVDCRYGDYLLITGVQGEIKSDFGVYCGRKDFKPYHIAGDFDKIVLTFHTNRKVQGSGFNLTYEQVDAPTVGGTSSGESTSQPNAGPQLLNPVTT